MNRVSLPRPHGDASINLTEQISEAMLDMLTKAKSSKTLAFDTLLLRIGSLHPRLIIELGLAKGHHN